MPPNIIPRVVLDTNVFISAILFGGNARKILEIARDGSIQLVTSKAILLELAEKLREKFQWEQDEIEDIIKGVKVFAKIVHPSIALHVIKKDPDDNMVLECAQEASAAYIISGDKKHILPLKTFRNTKIVSPAQFLKELKPATDLFDTVLRPSPLEGKDLSAKS